MLNGTLLYISSTIVNQTNRFGIMDSNKIQWILQHGSDNYKLQLEELLSQVNSVVRNALPVSITTF